MSATSIKLPEQLKQRLAQLARDAGQTPHAFMVDALAREANRAELQARFAAAAAQSEQQALSSGKAHSLDAAFDYLQTRLTQPKTRRPVARSWRASR